MDLGHQSRKRRHDSFMGTGSCIDPIDLDADSSSASKRLKTNDMAPSTLNVKIIKHLPPPVQDPIPKNLVETSSLSQLRKARIIDYIARMEARLRDPNDRMRDAKLRKQDIGAAMPKLKRRLTMLEPSDMATCIERVNVLVIHEHNKHGGKHAVEPVPYPPVIVAAMRKTPCFRLAPTPPEFVWEGLRRFTLWPLEFQYRLPLIRKLQLEDLARGYLEQCRKQERSEWFEEEWTTWCLRDNGAMGRQGPDYLDVDLLSR